VLVCWSIKGGVGTSVTAAALAIAAAARHPDRGALLVDAAGDQPALFGEPAPLGPGLAEWLGAGPDVSGDALALLEAPVGRCVAVVPRGRGPLRADRAATLVRQLEDESRPVVVDIGTGADAALGRELATAATTSLLVVRACPLVLPLLAELPVSPSGVIVVRHRRRTVTWQEIAEASGTTVVAELEVDPAVAAAVDAGLAHRALPRRFLRVLDGVR
jgi:hypothetical protein